MDMSRFLFSATAISLETEKVDLMTQKHWHV